MRNILNPPDKKNEILKSAAECFARFGYEKTTLDDIGKPIGLNKASLYYYYKNKESIFEDVIKRESGVFLDEINEKMGRIIPYDEKILFYLDERFKYLEKTVNLNKLSCEVTIKHQDFFNRLLDEFHSYEVAVISGILKEAIKKNKIQDCDAKRVSESILTVCDLINRKNFKYNDPYYADVSDYKRIESEVKFTVTLILKGLRKK